MRRLRAIARHLLPGPIRGWLRRTLLDQPDRAEVVLSRMPKGSVCAEIGVWKGEFSRQIVDTVEPNRLHLIDPWQFEEEDEYQDACYGRRDVGGQRFMDSVCDDVRRLFHREIDGGVVSIHRKRSADAANDFPDAYFDWVYIDANHLYEYARQDIDAYLRKVRPGGYVTGDDYARGGWWRGGVKKAVDEAIASGKCRRVALAGRQFVLQKV